MPIIILPSHILQNFTVAKSFFIVLQTLQSYSVIGRNKAIQGIIPSNCAALNKIRKDVVKRILSNEIPCGKQGIIVH